MNSRSYCNRQGLSSSFSKLSFDVVGKNAPYQEVVLLCNLNRCVFLIGRNEPDTFLIIVKAHRFKRELSIDESHNDVTVLRFQGLVYDKQVAVIDTAILHGISGSTGIEGGSRMTYESRFEVYAVQSCNPEPVKGNQLLQPWSANGNGSSLLRSAEYMVSFILIQVVLSPAFPYEEVLSQPQSYQPVSICADSVSDKP